jgi:uncharacterized phage-associated protein
MGNISFQFNEQKAIEVIVYLASKIKNPGIYSICKLIYLADKFSLEKYGRFIFGDTYCAMKKGATPSGAYNLLKDRISSTRGAFLVNRNRVGALREASLEYLSLSDLESLNWVIRKYGNLPMLQELPESHDNAWKLSWDRRGDKKSIPIPIENIAKLFPDADDLIDYLTNVG